MSIDYPLVWGALIAFAVMVYVLLDGFDLGIGILFPFLGGEAEQNVAMNSVAPVWDGNETWLILGGGGLYAVFPLAYAIILPAFYAPIMAMLLGLVLRGVAFEYRWRTIRGKFLWDWSFTAGSVIATFCQGLMLGTLVQGIDVDGRAYGGGWWDWLTPFSVLTGVALLVGYTLLGSTWLVIKTQGELQARVRKIAYATAFAMLGLMGIVSIWTPFLQTSYMAHWFSWPIIVFVMPVPILLFAFWISLLRGLKNEREYQPFFSALGMFVMCFIGLCINFYPNIVPPNISVWEAAGPDKSLSFLLVGAVVLIPLILIYTGHAYWTFRGKVDPEQGYH